MSKAVERGVFAAAFVVVSIANSGNVALANSCSNVTIHGSFDRSGIDESEYGIYAAGTFRIEGEKDESKQPFFNLTSINCEKQPDANGAVSVACKVTRASMYAESGEPNSSTPNCSLDLDITDFSMKETAPGILTGAAQSGICYNSFLSIDRNSKRVYLTFTKTQAAYGASATKLSACDSTPRTQVLMNCTSWARSRKNGQTSPRYCDFSSVSGR